jgi:hypothetical protein
VRDLPEDHRVLRQVGKRRAARDDPLVGAGNSRKLFARIGVRIELDVARDRQIQPAVTIEIRERGRRDESRDLESDIFESGSEILVENALPPSRDDEVCAPVAVEVGRGTARTPGRSGRSRRRSDVLEAAVPKVA